MTDLRALADELRNKQALQAASYSLKVKQEFMRYKAGLGEQHKRLLDAFMIELKKSFPVLSSFLSADSGIVFEGWYLKGLLISSDFSLPYDFEKEDFLGDDDVDSPTFLLVSGDIKLRVAAICSYRWYLFWIPNAEYVTGDIISDKFFMVSVPNNKQYDNEVIHWISETF